MDPREKTSAAILTDDIVVEILSRLPFKSFCRFKCVCKTWLAFSSDPQYCQKLPKVPTGFFYQDHSNNANQLVSLSKNNEDIDGTLSFLPDYEQLQLVDCCNGLILCEYRSTQTSDIFHFIVCNPATREWRTLPDAQREPDTFYYTIKLGFDPAMSPHFCVFNFHYDRGPLNSVSDMKKVEMFSSRNSTWLVYHDVIDRNDSISVSGRPHVFVDGYLHAHTDHDVWVLEELETAQIGRPPSNWTIKLPLHTVDCHADHCFRGCLGQFGGTLYYAAAERDGRTVLVWGHDYYYPDPDEWDVKHRLSMSDALGRDDFVHYEDGWFWTCNYEIIAIDMEREVLFLTDDTTKRLLSYNISTGELSEIKNSTHWYFYYVMCCLKLPAPESDISDDVRSGFFLVR